MREAFYYVATHGALRPLCVIQMTHRQKMAEKA